MIVKMKVTTLLVCLLLVVKNVFGANILYVATMCSPSHYIYNRALAYGLVQRGHNVTLISPDQDNYPKPKNYTFILMEGIYDSLNTNFDVNEMATYGSWQMLQELYAWGTHQCEESLKTQGLQHLLNYPSDFKFDLIIFDVTVGTCHLPLIKRFNYPPAIGVTAFLLPAYVSFNFGNHLHPAYIPWYGVQYTDEMTFVERVWNFIFTYADVFCRNKLEYNQHDSLSKKVFGEDTPTWDQLERHIELVLVNTDPILDFPQPLPPNMIPVGGLHTRNPKELPKDLQELLDNAKNGVILFSLGTNVRSDKLSIEQKTGLLGAFAQLKQTVVWKFESEVENLPKNVIVRKWLPQNDILGHPNVKLFIGHGGALSTQEAIYHGVPMVVIPFVVDQHVNARMITKRKLGCTIDSKRMTSDYILGKIEEVLFNPVYHQNMKLLSERFKDRPETPLERAVFWTEYVIRHGGANFLNTPARDMPLYQASEVDVFLFLIIIAIVVLLFIGKLIKLVSSAIRKDKKIKVN